MHCQVINNLPTSPQSLPVTWANVSNFNCLPDSELAKYGWYPYIQTPQPNCNPATHKLDRQLQFDGVRVNEVWTLVPLTADEQRAYLRSQRPLFAQFLKDYLNKSVEPRDYDNIGTAGDWTDDEDPEWAAESKIARRFRSACFKASYKIENEVAAGLRPIPTFSEFEAAMPRLGWGYPPENGGNGGGTGNGTMS